MDLLMTGLLTPYDGPESCDNCNDPAAFLVVTREDPDLADAITFAHDRQPGTVGILRCYWCSDHLPNRYADQRTDAVLA